MDFHEYSLGNVNGIRLGLVSTMALTGFIGIIILPFYVYLFGTGIFWEFFGIIVSVLVIWNHRSYRLMRYARKSESIVTLPSYFSRRFDDKKGVIRMLSSVEIITLSIIISGLLLRETAIILNAMIGLDKGAFSLIFVLVVSCYVGILGFNSMVKTVYVKVTFFILAFLFICLFIFTRQSIAELVRNMMRTDITGSVSEYLNVLFHNGKLLKVNDYITLISKGLLVSGMPFVLVSFFSAKDSKTITKGRNTSFVFLVVFFSISMFAGAILRGFLFPEKITKSISGFMTLIYQRLHSSGSFGKVVSYIFVLLIIIAAASIIEAFINTITVIVYEDIINRGNVVRVDQKHMRETLIAISMMVGIAIFFTQQYIHDVKISGMVSFVTVLGCSISPTVFLSLSWERMNRAGCMAGLIFGLVAVPFFEYAPILSVDGARKTISEALGISPILPAIIISCLVIILFSLLTKKPDEDIVDEFLEVRNRIVD